MSGRKKRMIREKLDPVRLVKGIKTFEEECKLVIADKDKHEQWASEYMERIARQILRDTFFETRALRELARRLKVIDDNASFMGFTNVVIDLDVERDYDDDIERSVTIFGERPETREERLKRERERRKRSTAAKKAAAARAAKKEERDRKTYERLKQRFGDK